MDPHHVAHRTNRPAAGTLKLNICLLTLALLAQTGIAESHDLQSGGPSPMTAEDAVKLAISHNPQIAAGLAGLAASRSTYLALGVPVPLTIGASQVQGTSNAPSLTGDTIDTIVNLGGSLDTSGQRRYQAAGARAAYKVAFYELGETLLSLEQQVRDAYWSLAASEAQAKIADQSLLETQKVYDLTVAQEKAGTSPKADVVRSSIDVANARQARLTAQNAHQAAQFAFNTLLARRPEDSVTLADVLGETLVAPSTSSIPRVEELAARARQDRPLLRAATEQVHAANYSVRQAEASRLPDLNVLYERSVRQQVDAWTFSISLPLFEFGSISHTINSAKHARTQAAAQERQNEAMVMQQVSQARADLATAAKAVQSYRAEILEPSVKLLDMAKVGYEQGATGILPVLDAESTVRNARTGYINALLSFRKAEDELNAAIGKTTTPMPKK
ncbi:MAG: TolC family protein [Fimbriimonas sp.]|nr:TolC family protein [Fimbriimonas sp.]